MSQTYTLTTIDTTGIQNYIFGSNRLRENVGASALVEQATADWVLELVGILVERHNIKPATKNTTFYAQLDQERWIERDHLQAEILYSGGGNTVVLFAERQKAIEFVTAYTKRLLEEAPGLEVACVHQTVQWDNPKKNLRAALRETGTLLAQKKAIRPLPTPILGLGVTAECESTGLPATDFDPLYSEVIEPERRRYRPVSSTIFGKAKRETQEWSRQRLEALFPAFQAVDCDFWYNPDDTSDLLDENEGEGRYIAVVHADGNRMGERFHAILSGKQTTEVAALTDRAALQLLRQLSSAVDNAGRQAMKVLGDQLAKLVGSIVKGKHYLQFFERDKKGKYTLDWEIQLAYNKKRDKYVIPFRPLIYGGDDITFVCDGQLGLTLATLYLSSFEDAIARELEGADCSTLRHLLQSAGMEKIYACAGVAIVKLHYPFSRAYQLADELCKSAKAYVRGDGSRESEDFSALDWHFATGGLYGPIGMIRKREYRTSEGELTMRPVSLRRSTNVDEWRNWPNFVCALRTFAMHDDWREKQNKVIQLRDALRKGPSAVKAYLLAYKLQQLPELTPNQQSLQSEGWADDKKTRRCGHFDVIEALEFYRPLQEEAEK